jgi:transcriptional regulator with XRE-family HTH domain
MSGADDPREPLGEFLRQQRQLAELTLNQFAGMVGISNAYLSQIERGLRKPSQDVLASIANGLHLSADAVEAHLPRAEEADESDVLRAIAADTRLTRGQRAALAETYRAFLAQSSGRPRRRRSEEE